MSPLPMSSPPRLEPRPRPWLRPLDGMTRLAWGGATVAVFYVMLLTAAGRQGAWLIGADGHPRPMDFAIFWLAARMSAAGQAHAVYDVARFGAALVGFSGDRTAKLPFVYPPLFLLLVSPLSALPYVWAAAVWLFAGLSAYLSAARAILSRWCAPPLALAAPGVLWCVVVAQNGFLTAALLGWGLVLAPRRPVLAGATLGVLAFKPQLALALPVAFLAVGAWRTIAAAAVTAGTLTMASILRFGPSIAPAFLQATAQANARLGGAHMPWAKVQSLYGALRGAGVSLPAAAAAHVLAAGVAALALAKLWRSGSPYALKAAAVGVATLVLTPYSFVYDLPILGVAALFLLRDAARAPFTAAEAALLALGVFSPLSFALASVAVTPVACAALAAVIVLRVRRSVEDRLRRFNVAEAQTGA